MATHDGHLVSHGDRRHPRDLADLVQEATCQLSTRLGVVAAGGLQVHETRDQVFGLEARLGGVGVPDTSPE